MATTMSEPVAITLTAEEYAQLPPSSRVELVDGVLSVGEPPTGLHQDVVYHLRRLLEAVCPRQLRVVCEQEVRLGEVWRRNPDLMVIRRDAYDPHGCSYLPSEVVLAVEVVSPTSQAQDRLHKPAEYAQAGIGHYWRVETVPGLAVHTHLLDGGGSYLATGRFTPGNVVAAPGLPWARVPVADLNA